MGAHERKSERDDTHTHTHTHTHAYGSSSFFGRALGSRRSDGCSPGRGRCRTLLFAVGILPLLVQISGCDRAGDAEGEASMGQSGAGIDSGGVCEPPAAPEETSLLDNANCIVRGMTIASCSASTQLLRNCDAAFIEWCDGAGGDVEACAEDEIKDLSVPECADGDPSKPSCDVDFFDECDALDWQIAGGVDPATGSGPGTTHGTCVPIPSVNCCPLGNDAPSPDSDWLCSCDGPPGLSGKTKVFGAMLECFALIAEHGCLGSLGSQEVHCGAPFGDDGPLPPSCG